jgi:hypothetical protein
LIKPLHKRKKSGELYRRRDTIELILNELLALDREELFARCSIRSTRDPKRVPSECLLYLVRACRDDNTETWFNRLWPLLIQRVRDRIPRIDAADGKVSSARMAVRDQMEGRFLELIAEDRDVYQEALDYLEVNFDGGLSKRKLDAQQAAWREENRSRPLEDTERPGEISSEVEAAVGDFDPFAENVDEVYRLRLDAAIEALPKEQIRIIEMLRLDIPIDSKDPFAITIAKTLGRSEKTIRTYRDKAFAAIRTAVEEEDGE